MVLETTVYITFTLRLYYRYETRDVMLHARRIIQPVHLWDFISKKGEHILNVALF